jgi:hypothetical protein
MPGKRSVPRLAACVAAIVLALSGAADAGGQAPTEDGTYSISFGFDGGSGPEAGLWYGFGRVRMGVLGSLDWRRTRHDDGQDVESRTAVALGPRAKWYLDSAPPVAPFWFGGLELIVDHRTLPDGTSPRHRGVGFQGGFGADWFPVDSVSFGGWTGLHLSFVSERDADRSTTRLRTLTTGLTVHLYF